MTKKAKKTKTAKLPKVLFIKRAKYENDPGEYFVASEDTVGMVDIGDTILVGKYVLDETYKLEGVVKSEPVK